MCLRGCGKRFFEVGDRKKHEKICGLPKPFHCEFCFHDVDDLPTHYRNCRSFLKSQSLIPCQGCKAVFQTDEMCQEHMKNCNKVKNYQCDICGASIAQSKQAFLEHMRAHDPARQTFYCDQCGKCFNREKRWKLHVKSHQPPQACVFCQEMVPGGKHPVRNCSARNQNTRCPYCGDEVKNGSKSRVFRHVTRKHPEMKEHFIKEFNYNQAAKPWSCKYCEKELVTSFNLEKHEERCKARFPYACGACEETFASIDDARNHFDSCTKANMEHISGVEIIYQQMDDDDDDDDEDDDC